MLEIGTNPRDFVNSSVRDAAVVEGESSESLSAVLGDHQKVLIDEDDLVEFECDNAEILCCFNNRGARYIEAEVEVHYVEFWAGDPECLKKGPSKSGEPR